MGKRSSPDCGKGCRSAAEGSRRWSGGRESGGAFEPCGLPDLPGRRFLRPAPLVSGPTLDGGTSKVLVSKPVPRHSAWCALILPVAGPYPREPCLRAAGTTAHFPAE
jgi:hypothetical protein